MAQFRGRRFSRAEILEFKRGSEDGRFMPVCRSAGPPGAAIARFWIPSGLGCTKRERVDLINSSMQSRIPESSRVTCCSTWIP
jgi:hypothetical protein